MNIANIPRWLQPSWEQLVQMQKQPPPAVLMISPQSRDAHVLSQLWAKLLLCESLSRADKDRLPAKPCDECRSCREFSAETHPDYLHVARPDDKRELTVDQIREAIHWSTKTARQSRRVLYIQDAETLNTNAANAFLKTLEEPAEGLVIVLSCRRLNTLPITLRSRCHRMGLKSPRAEELREYLESLERPSAKIEAALELMPADAFSAALIDDDSLERLARWKQAWKRGIEQGDTMAAAEILDDDDWPQAMVWLQRKMLTWAQQSSAGDVVAEAWNISMRMRAMASIALNRRLQIEELLMLLRSAWRKQAA